MSYINCTEVVPENREGLEGYKFVTPYEGTIYVYHHDCDLGWLCCTEGWHLKENGEWQERISCGWKPDRIANAVEDILNYYRK